MKKVIYILFFALAVILSFTACDREKMDNDTVELGEGSVNLASLKGLSVEVSSSTPITRASEVNTDNYLIRTMRNKIWYVNGNIASCLRYLLLE